jgi:uncharacterized membrane protein
MNKRDFLDKLMQALTENMDERDAFEHINYYDNYIEEELAKGKKEEDIISSLGNPRLIAKSIADRNPNAGKNYYSNVSEFEEKGEEKNHTINFNLNKFFVILGSILFVIVVLAIISVIGMILIKLVFPILVIVLLISLISGILKR